MKVTLYVDVKPKDGQSQGDAEVEMAGYLYDYLTDHDYPLYGDYGAESQEAISQGWDGPWINGVAFTCAALPGERGR